MIAVLVETTLQVNRGLEEMNEATAKMLAEFFNVAVEVIKEK
ncbi:hypothetical protein WKW43_14245 (plasmid) [Staphylococcus pseudoxylosus]